MNKPEIRVGLDMDEIARVENMLASSDRFAERILGEQELAYFREHGKSAETLTAAFCAKEAFGKALGTGVRGFALSEVQVLHDPLGKPYYELSGKAKELADEGGWTFELSLTHTKTTAAAVAVAYR
ncbi:MAG: holo-ACP synthase [Clostridia bacterium]|nr:holo-ACP synthase [Clostridia bacterium]